MMIPSLPAHTIQFSLFPHSCVGLLSHAERSADNTGYGDNCDYAGDGCDNTHDDYNGDDANNTNDADDAAAGNAAADDDADDDADGDDDADAADAADDADDHDDGW